MDLFLLLAGLVVVFGVIAAVLRHFQREVDEVDQAEYRPPPIHGQAGPH